MATPQGGTPFEPGIIQRVAEGIRYVVNGNRPAWFGPNEPMAPQAPDDVKGRPTDFPVGMNLQYQPKREASESGLTFDVLRRVSDPAAGGLDIMRLAIETRKDQMEAQRWQIVGKDGAPAGQKGKDLEMALRRPDLVHTYRQWQRMLLEDLFVIDAPTLYLRPTPDGFRVPEVVDGATIKLLVDPNGRRPLPPDPAYQQILKGLPAVDYSLDELLYAPRNLRPNRFYGMSPVEQAINMVNLGLKRQLHLIDYYTAGNVPEQLVAAPELWNSDQIERAQLRFDSILAGNLEARRKLIIVPGGMEPKPLKDAALTDPLDEWIARVICWCFSISPQGLVKEMNRATAQTGAQQARLEGLNPIKEWWTDVMNEVISRCWGVDDLEFSFVDEDIVDPNIKATVLTTYVAAKVMTPDEAREQLGMKPLTPEQKDELNPPPPPGLGGPGLETPGGDKVPIKPGDSQGADRDSASGLPPASDSEKVEKKKTIRPLNRRRPAVKRTEKGIRAAATKYLDGIRAALLKEINGGASKLAKADMSPDEFKDWWDSLADDDRQEFVDRLEDLLGTMSADGADEALSQVFELVGYPAENALDAMLSQANEKAIAWAADHAARLVTQIDETTRGGIQDLVGKALEEGWSNDDLAARIQESEGFSDYRAEMIARTETAFADVQGNLAGYRESGVVEGQEWLIAQDEYCEDCDALDGMVVDIGGDFPDGPPPLHPNCRCTVLPVLTRAEEG